MFTHLAHTHENVTGHSAHTPDSNLIDLRQITKTYQTGGKVFTALDAVTLTIGQGEFTAIVGKSGSGKSTLLNIMTGIDRPSSGEVIIAGTPIHTLSENQMAIWRGKSIGVVFQFFQLLPTLTALENVMLPMDLCNVIPGRERRPRALDLLKQMGVVEQAHKLPTMLSGGEQQRVAIARALANNPPLLMADEPTGNLDSRTTERIFGLLQDLARDGKTVVMVSHERDVLRWATRTITLADGNIITDESQEAQHVESSPA